MYRNSVLKQIVFFIIGSLINTGMFCLSKYAGFPIWADFTGSVYVMALAGPLPALISIALHLLLLIVLIDGSYALWYAVPALFICILVYIIRKKDMPLSPTNICALGFTGSVVSFVTAWTAFAINGAAGRRTWVLPLIDDALGRVIMSAGIGLTETALTLLLFYLVYLITPKKDDKLIFKR